MIVIDESWTLAEVVEARPDLARELERRKLDYCCGGRRTVGDACALIGLDGQRVAAELTALAPAGPPAEWSTMTAAELADHLERTHHRYLWDELPRISALLERIVAAHGARHPELSVIAARFAEVRADLEPHMTKEERVLFPMIRELVASSELPSFHCGTLRKPISVMLAEHDRVGELLAELRHLTDDHTPPADGCASYRACFAALAELEADTHLHIHKENNVLFPAVVRLEAERASAVGP